MGEIRFNRLGFNPNRFQAPNPNGIGFAGKSHAKNAPELNLDEAKDTLALRNRSPLEAGAKADVTALENPNQVIRLAVATDPRGSSLHPATLGMLRNPPEDASGFSL